MSEKNKTIQKLEQILLNFIDVLRINILIVDPKGNPVLVPKTSGYGFHGATQWGLFQYLGTPEFISKFKIEGDYLKSVDNFGFQSFALPMPLGKTEEIGYLIVGPVILNKQAEPSQYQRIAQSAGVNYADFLECLGEVRVVTFNSLKSILDLLFELSRYALRINDSEKDLTHSVFVNLLDLAMAITQAECGSIMLLNKLTNELTIQVFKGIDLQRFQNTSIKLDDGIAGLAVQNKEPFVINEEHSSNRISRFLKKPELKCALVLPIIRNNNEVLGVLNLSTRQGTSQLATHPQQMLKSLLNITSGTFSNFAANF